MYVLMLFYMYQLTSLSEENAWPGLQPLSLPVTSGVIFASVSVLTSRATGKVAG